jgi:hypothetical protein
VQGIEATFPKANEGLATRDDDYIRSICAVTEPESTIVENATER